MSLSWSAQRAVNYGSDESSYLSSLQTDLSRALNVSVSRVYITSAKFSPNVSLSFRMGVLDNLTDIVAHAAQISSAPLLTTRQYAQMMINYFSGVAQPPRSTFPVWTEVVNVTPLGPSAGSAVVLLNVCPDKSNYYQTGFSSYCPVVPTVPTTTTTSPTTVSTSPFSAGQNTTLYLVIPIVVGVVLCSLILMCVGYQVNYEREKQRKELESALKIVQQSELKKSFRSQARSNNDGAVHSGGSTTTSGLNPFHSSLIHSDSMRKVGKPRGKDRQGFAPQQDVDDDFFLESARGSGPAKDFNANSPEGQAVSLAREDASTSPSDPSVIGAKKFALRGMSMTQMEERRSHLMDLEIARDAQRRIWKETDNNREQTQHEKGKRKSKGKGKHKAGAAEEEELTARPTTEDDEQWVDVRADGTDAIHSHQSANTRKDKSKQQTAADSEFVELTVRSDSRKKKDDTSQPAIRLPKSQKQKLPFPGAEDEQGVAHMSWTDTSPSASASASASTSASSSSSASGSGAANASNTKSARSAPSKFYAAEDLEDDEPDKVEVLKKKDNSKPKKARPQKESTDESADLP